MLCPKCGFEIAEGAKSCHNCGAEMPVEPAPKKAKQESADRPKISARAVASPILSILFLLPIAGILFALFGIIYGIVALIQIAKSRGKLRGWQFALAGIIVGILGIIFLIPPTTWIARKILSKLPMPVEQSIVTYTGIGMSLDIESRSRTSRTKTDLRTIAGALEGYYRDHKSYPPWATGEAGANSFAGPHAGAYHIHTFRIWHNDTEAGTFPTLTTPLPYLHYYPSDLFASTRGATYGYYSDDNGWIVFSWGPDYDENKRESWDLDPDVEMVYRASIRQPSLTLMCGSSSLSGEAYTYDPTNGAISPGDIYRVKQ